VEAELNLMTVLFADMTGSTELYASRGDREAFTIATDFLKTLEGEVAALQGRTIKRMGDGILAIFASPDDALMAAIRMREKIDATRGLASQGARVRSGISYGEGVLSEDDVYGDVVNVAARLVDRAVVDEILVSGAVYEKSSPSLREHLRLIGRLRLRKRPAPALVYEYLEQEEGATRATSQGDLSLIATLEVSLEPDMFVLGAERQSLTIGRAPENDIVIDQVTASRRHVVINAGSNKFILTDLSTNGTFVCFDSGDVVHLKREGVTLVGGGRILVAGEDAPAITFRVVLS